MGKKMYKSVSLISILSLLLWFAVISVWSPEIQAQTGALPGQTAYISHGRVLTSDMVRAELERRIARNPGNEASLWNAGYDFFRNFPRNQTTAQAIKIGFLSARNGTPEQRATLRKAAIYWEKIHNSGITNVAVARNNQNRNKIYYGSRKKFTTMAKRPSGSLHPGFSGYDWPGRNINRRQPYEGRGRNPYPGKYFPGMYPP